MSEDDSLIKEDVDGLQEEGKDTETSEEVGNEPLVGLEDEEDLEEDDAKDESKDESEPDADETLTEDEQLTNFKKVRLAARESEKQLRIKNRELKDLQRRLAEIEGGAPKQEEELTLPPKPAARDFEWDEEKHNAALDDWYEKKAAVEKQKEAKKLALEERQKNQEAIWNRFEESKKTLNLKDYQDLQDIVEEALTKEQQGAIISGIKDPARVVAMLGRNPKRLAEYAKIKNIAEFAVEIGSFKKEIDMQRVKKDKPAPERTLSGAGSGGAGGQGVQAQLARLESEAEKSGNRNAVVAFRRKHNLY